MKLTIAAGIIHRHPSCSWTSPRPASTLPAPGRSTTYRRTESQRHNDFPDHALHRRSRAAVPAIGSLSRAHCPYRYRRDLMRQTDGRYIAVCREPRVPALRVDCDQFPPFNAKPSRHATESSRENPYISPLVRSIEDSGAEVTEAKASARWKTSSSRLPVLRQGDEAGTGKQDGSNDERFIAF